MMKNFFKDNVTMEVATSILFIPDTKIPIAAISGAVLKSTGCGEIAINPIMWAGDDTYYVIPEDYVLMKICGDVDDLAGTVKHIADGFEVSNTYITTEHPTRQLVSTALDLVVILGSVSSTELDARYTKLVDDIGHERKLPHTDQLIFEIVDGKLEVQKSMDDGYYVGYVIDNLDAIKFNM